MRNHKLIDAPTMQSQHGGSHALLNCGVITAGSTSWSSAGGW